MSDYDNTNRGALFKSKTPGEKRPDYTGKLNVDGRDYRIAAWLRKSKSNETFMSLSVEPDDGNRSGGKGKQSFDDKDLPF